MKLIEKEKLNAIALQIQQQIKKECQITDEKIIELKNHIVNNYQDYKKYRNLRYIRNEFDYLVLEANQVYNNSFSLRRILNELIVVQEIQSKQSDSLISRVLGINSGDYKKELVSIMSNIRFPKPKELKTINQRYIIKYFGSDQYTKNDFQFIFKLQDIKAESYPFVTVIQLDIDFPSLDNKTISKYQQTFFNSTQLKELRINFCQKDKTLSLKGLIQILSLCLNISTLHLCIKLDSNELAEIFNVGNAITNLKNLRKIEMIQEYSKIKENKLAVHLFNSIDDFYPLQELSMNLSNSNLNQNSSLLFNDLKKFCNLCRLDLSLKRCSIPKEEIINLGITIRKLVNLTNVTLNLIGNELKNEGCQSISDGLSYCNNLEFLFLELNENKNTIDSYIYLIKALSSCQKLKSIALFGFLDETERTTFFQFLCKQTKHFQRLQCLTIIIFSSSFFLQLKEVQPKLKQKLNRLVKLNYNTLTTLIN